MGPIAATAAERSDKDRAVSGYLLKEPSKAAQELARMRKRIAELAAGATPYKGERSIETLERLAARLEWAFVDERRCEDCGRPLEDDQSVERRVGPDCWAKSNGSTTPPGPRPAADLGGDF